MRDGEPHEPTAKMVLVDGVPGCGKTKEILARVDLDEDLGFSHFLFHFNTYIILLHFFVVALYNHISNYQSSYGIYIHQNFNGK